jgi:glutamyl-tRNA synthetase
LLPHVMYQFEKLGLDLNQGPSLESLILVQKERVKTLKEMAEKSACFYKELVYEPIAKEKFLSSKAKKILKVVHHNLDNLQTWDKEELQACIHHCMQEVGVKMPELAQPLRVAIIGDTISPSIDSTLMLLGREKTLNRLQQSIELITD